MPHGIWFRFRHKPDRGTAVDEVTGIVRSERRYWVVAPTEARLKQYNVPWPGSRVKLVGTTVER